MTARRPRVNDKAKQISRIFFRKSILAGTAGWHISHTMLFATIHRHQDTHSDKIHDNGTAAIADEGQR